MCKVNDFIIRYQLQLCWAKFVALQTSSASYIMYYNKLSDKFACDALIISHSNIFYRHHCHLWCERVK